MNIKSLLIEFAYTKEQVKLLKEEYAGKNKGPVYGQRAGYLARKLQDIHRKINTLGKGKIIIYEITYEDYEGQIKKVEISYSQEISEEDVKLLILLRIEHKTILSIVKHKEIILGEPQIKKE